MKELSPKIWIGLPAASFLLCLCTALVDVDLYKRLISTAERGYLEHSTVLMLLPAAFLSGWLCWKWRAFPQRWLAGWAALLCLGAIFFAGEEASWGQHYFQWNTPEYWKNINDQHETNIHNTHGIFDQVPRGLLTAAAIISLIVSPLLLKQRKSWAPHQDWREWVFPTVAVIPTAVLVIAIGLPQKFYGNYGSQDPNIPGWFDSMFLRGAHSEFKEHFLAMFVFMYVVSCAYRFKTLYAAQSHSMQAEGEDQRNPKDAIEVRSAA